MTIKTNCVSLADFVTLRPDFISSAFSRRGWEEFQEYLENCGIDEIDDNIIDNAFQDYSEYTLQEYIESWNIKIEDFANEDDFLQAAIECGNVVHTWEDCKGINVIIDEHLDVPKDWRKENS